MDTLCVVNGPMYILFYTVSPELITCEGFDNLCVMCSVYVLSLLSEKKVQCRREDLMDYNNTN